MYPVTDIFSITRMPRCHSTDLPAPVLALNAMVSDPVTGEFLGIETGIGDVVSNRISGIYEQDFEGIFRLCLDGEPVLANGRLERNWAKQTFDLTDPAWIKDGATVEGGYADPDGGNNAFRVDLTAASSRVYQLVHSDDIGIDSDITAPVWIRLVSGTNNLRIYTGRTTGTKVIDNADLSSQWQQIYVPGILSGSNNNRIGVTCASGGLIVEIYAPQYFVVTGKSNKVPPSTIVSGQVPAARVYDRTNANTASGSGDYRFVNHAQGSWLSTPARYKCQPEASNTMLYSTDLLNASSTWTYNGLDTGICVQDAVGHTGLPNTAMTLKDEESTYSTNVQQSNTAYIADDSNSHCFVVDIEKDSNEARFPRIRAICTGGTSGMNLTLGLNTKTGVASEIVNTDSASDWEVVDYGNSWRVILQMNNNSTGNTDLNYLINPAWGDVIGVQNVATQGSIVIRNVEEHLNKTIAQVRHLGPIFCEASAQSVDAAEYELDKANHDDSASVYVMEVEPTIDSAELAVATGILTPGSSLYRLAYFDNANTGVWYSSDGTTWSGHAHAYSKGVAYKYAIAYSSSEGKRKAYVNGVGAEHAYDGSFSEGADVPLTIGKDAAYPFYIRGIERWSGGDYASHKSKALERTAA